MKPTTALCSVALLAGSLHAAQAGTASPIGKVVQLLSDLQSKIIAEGEEAHKTYSEFSEWCEERSKNLGFEIKTAKEQVAALKATIAEEEAMASALSSKIETLGGERATNEADLKAATEIRDKEAADFAAEEKELMEVIDTLERAISILEREMRKGGASMVQLKNAGGLTQALGLLVQASALSSADAERLAALVKSSQESDDGDASLGAPDAAVYQSQSGGIVETLEGLLEKAEAQLAEARKKETADLHNYQLLKQSLEDELKFGAKDMAEAQKALAQSGEKKATAEGDLEATSKVLGGDTGSLADLHQTCLTKAQDYEAATKSRGEELKALAEAKKALTENTAGADELSYGLSQVSLVQLSSGAALSSGVDLANFEAVRFVRDLARKQHSPALAQLASRMASAVRSSASAGDDPFSKVKGLIADMIERLEGEANADASHKAYCDKELAETETKEGEKTAEIAKLSTKIDQMTARSQQLAGEVAALQKALAELAAAQAEMDKLRQTEHEDFVKAKADMEQGLEGVKMALKVLREYYSGDSKAHAAAEGAGAGIIGLLEVIESDFSKGLAEMTATEEAAAASYDRESKENEIDKTTKEQDVKYKSQERSGLDKAAAEASSDRSGVQAELDAVMEYMASLKKQCVEKAETYEERKARFEAELAGLKEALKILETETVLLERSSKRTLRGVSRHAQAAQ